MPEPFSATIPTGATIVCTAERWETILAKHPVLDGGQADVMNAISSPSEIRESRWDPLVWLCYGSFQGRLLCVVVRPGAGLLITAYPTDAVKQGDVVWTP